jgi:hypothetical protein
MIGQGDTLFSGGYLGEGAEAFAEPEGEGFGSWFLGVFGFGLLFECQGNALGDFCISKIM